MNLTIVTVNRNNSKGLRKTMESVLSQSFKDYEYIILDGASTDDSIEVIKSLRIFKKESGTLLPFIRTVLVRKSITIQRTFYDKQGFTVLKDIGDKQELVSNLKYGNVRSLMETI